LAANTRHPAARWWQFGSSSSRVVLSPDHCKTGRLRSRCSRPAPRELGHLKCQPPRAKDGDRRKSRVTEEQIVSMLREAEAG